MAIVAGLLSSHPRCLGHVVSDTAGTWLTIQMTVQGKLLLGGTGVQRVREDGVAELDIRAALQADAGENLLLNGRGMRCIPPVVAEQMARGENPDPLTYYFREAFTFEASSLSLSWLSRMLDVGVAAELWTECF